MEDDSSRPTAFGLGATCPFQNLYCSLHSPLRRFSVHHKLRASKVMKARGLYKAHSSQSLLALSSTPEVYLAARRAWAELLPIPLPPRMETSAFLPSLLVVPALSLAPGQYHDHTCAQHPKCWGLQGQASWIWWLSRLGLWTYNPQL